MERGIVKCPCGGYVDVENEPDAFDADEGLWLCEACRFEPPEEDPYWEDYRRRAREVKTWY